MSAASGDMCINFEKGKAPNIKEVVAGILCKEDMPVLSHLPDRLQTNTGYVLDDSRNAVMIERKQKLDAEEGMPFHQRVKLGQMKKGAEATNIKYDCDLVYHKFTSLVYLYELEADGSLGHLMAWVDGAWKRSMNFEQRGCKVYTPAKEDILLTGSEDDCVLAVYVHITKAIKDGQFVYFRRIIRLGSRGLDRHGKAFAFNRVYIEYTGDLDLAGEFGRKRTNMGVRRHDKLLELVKKNSSLSNPQIAEMFGCASYQVAYARRVLRKRGDIGYQKKRPKKKVKSDDGETSVQAMLLLDS